MSSQASTRVGDHLGTLDADYLFISLLPFSFFWLVPRRVQQPFFVVNFILSEGHRNTKYNIYF